MKLKKTSNQDNGNNGLVTITQYEYDSLRQDSLMLECLNKCGSWMVGVWGNAAAEFNRRIGELG